MGCDYQIHQPLHYVVRIIVDCGAVFFTLVSFTFVVSNTAMDQSLRGIVLSFSLANVMGAGMLSYNTLVSACGDESHSLDFLISITITLSLSHMLLLMLVEYIVLTTGSRQRARDYTGFILISWIISLTHGSMKVVTVDRKSRVVFAIVDLLIVLFILVKHSVIKKEQDKKRRIQRIYRETFLRLRYKEKKVVWSNWKFVFVRIITFSHIMCSLPWVLNELFEGLNMYDHNPEAHSVSIIVYSLNFYFSSAIWTYLKFSKSRKPMKRTYSYRIRSTYSYTSE